MLFRRKSGTRRGYFRVGKGGRGTSGKKTEIVTFLETDEYIEGVNTFSVSYRKVAGRGEVELLTLARGGGLFARTLERKLNVDPVLTPPQIKGGGIKRYFDFGLSFWKGGEIILWARIVVYMAELPRVFSDFPTCLAKGGRG